MVALVKERVIQLHQESQKQEVDLRYLAELHETAKAQKEATMADLKSRQKQLTLLNQRSLQEARATGPEHQDVQGWIDEVIQEEAQEEKTHTSPIPALTFGCPFMRQ